MTGKLTTKLAGVEPALGTQGARKKPETMAPHYDPEPVLEKIDIRVAMIYSQTTNSM